MSTTKEYTIPMEAIHRAPLNKQVLLKTKKQVMVFNDVSILSKKIFVGFLIYIIPLTLVAGGLWGIKILLTR